MYTIKELFIIVNNLNSPEEVQTFRRIVKTFLCDFSLMQLAALEGFITFKLKQII